MKTIIQFSSIESFSTNRLFAEKMKADDFDKLVKLYTDRTVMLTLGGLRSREQIQENLNWNLAQWEKNGFGLWIFYLKDSSQWVGYAGMGNVTVNQIDEIEVAYALQPQFWQQGLATEMTLAAVEIAFEVLRLDSLVCFTLTTNQASQRVMQKAGFQFEKNISHADLPHVLYRIKDPRQVKVIDYKTDWIELFQNEANRIQQLLKTSIREIYHVGSTAIPHMPAKPIIDMLLVCENLDEIDLIYKKLAQLGYRFLRRQIIPHHSFFIRKEENNIAFHLHIYERGNTQINRHVNFRDYLIAHPDDAKVYAELKKELAQKFPNDIKSYVMGKDLIVQAIDAKAKHWLDRKKDYLPVNTGPNAKNWGQEKLTKSMITNLNTYMTHFAQYLNQVKLIRIPGFTIVDSGLADDTFNYILDADFSSSEAEKKIAEATNYFIERQLPFSWWVSPLDKPSDLAVFLEKNGYQNTETHTAMFFDLDNWQEEIAVNCPVEIVQAKDEKTLLDFASVLTNHPLAFKQHFSWIASVLSNDDPIEYFVGYVQGKPVVRGSICYAGQVAGFYWLSTAIEERKKGYANAMQQYRLKRATDHGYHIAVLLASSEAFSLDQRLGFKKFGDFREFKLPMR